MKEFYDNMKLMLEPITYRDFQWQVCGDLKVVPLLLGMQSTYAKFCYLSVNGKSLEKNKQKHIDRRKEGISWIYRMCKCLNPTFFEQFSFLVFNNIFRSVEIISPIDYY